MREVVVKVRCDSCRAPMDDDAEPIAFTVNGNSYQMDLCATSCLQKWQEILEMASLVRKKPGRPRKAKTDA